jgi:hypothetical protein
MLVFVVYPCICVLVLFHFEVLHIQVYSDRYWICETYISCLPVYYPKT